MNWLWQTVIDGVVRTIAGVFSSLSVTWLNRKKVQQERLESAINELHHEIERLVGILREAAKKPIDTIPELIADSKALKRQWKLVCRYLSPEKVEQLQTDFANVCACLGSNSNHSEQKLTDFQRKLDFIAGTDRSE
jgi:hypothetical protein